jgi:hypothetical protein
MTSVRAVISSTLRSTSGGTPSHAATASSQPPADWLADRLHEQKHLRPGVNPADAAHTIWLRETAERALLAPA